MPIPARRKAQPWVLSFLLAAAAPAAALPMQAGQGNGQGPGQPPGLGAGAPGLGLGGGSLGGPPEEIFDLSPGPPGLGNGVVPVNIERTDDSFLLEIFHPRADELLFADPFLSIRVTPGAGPNTVQFLARPGKAAVIPEPSTLLLVTSAGVVALVVRRWRAR